jgi:hypothetical protein
MASTMDPKTLKKYIQFGKGKSIDKETVVSIIDMFSKFDEDKSGEFSPDELVKCMKEYFRLHFKIKLDLVERLTRAKLNSVDKDKSGQLNLDEFFDLFIGVLEQIPATQRVRVPLSGSQASLSNSTSEAPQVKTSEKKASVNLKGSIDGTLLNNESDQTQNEKVHQPELTSGSTHLTDSTSLASEVTSREIDFSEDLSTQEEEESQKLVRNQAKNKENGPELTATATNLTEKNLPSSQVTSRSVDLNSDLHTQEEESQTASRSLPKNQTEKPAAHSQTEKSATHSQTEKPATHSQTEKLAAHSQTEKPASQAHTEKLTTQTSNSTKDSNRKTTSPSQAQDGRVRISFSLHYDTVFGENLFVVGESEELGNWDPLRGLRMAWWPGNYWSIETDLPSGHDFKWKYALVELEEGPWYVKRWEEAGPRLLTREELSGKSQHCISSEWERVHGIS